MAAIPPCPNHTRGFGCARSDVIVKEEQEDSWVLFCRCCELVWVLSKDGVREKSKLEISAKRREQQEEINRRWEQRRKFFA
jgi:hypothetical protein